MSGSGDISQFRKKWLLPASSIALLLLAIIMASQLTKTIVYELIESRALKNTTEFTNELTKSLNPFGSDGSFSHLDQDTQKAVLSFAQGISHIDRLIIINSDFIVVYDSLGERLGQNYNDKDLMRAINSRSIVTKKDKSIINSNGIYHSPYVYESYSPILKDNKVVGILELYYDAGEYAETIKKAANICFSVFVSISLIFTLFILILYTRSLDDKERTLSITTDLRNKAEESSIVAQESLVRQKRFIANAAHELRTPLSILRARLDGMDQFPGRSLLANDIDRVVRLTDQLLSIAILNSKRIDLNETITLKSLCINTVAALVPLALSEQKFIDLNYDDASTFNVRGNSFYLEGALRNIIENAIRYTPKGERVDVTIHTNGTLDIADRGPGVPKELRNRIFEPFTQGTERKGKAGLGLAIVAETIALHGGTITILDREGGGSTFRISLPAVTDPVALS